MVHPIAAFTLALFLVRSLIAGGLLMVAAVFIRRR
jgi:hypothetical protein